MKKKTIKQLRAELAERNATFEAMTVDQKRVAIALDLQQQILLRQFIPEHKYYLMRVEKDNKPKKGQSYQELIASGKTIECSGCAIAGFLHSRICVSNNVFADADDVVRSFDTGGYYVSELHGKQQATKNLESIFTFQELNLLECAFEGNMEHSNTYSMEEWEASRIASNYFETFDYTTDEKLIALTQMIIETGGKVDMNYYPERTPKQIIDDFNNLKNDN